MTRWLPVLGLLAWAGSDLAQVGVSTIDLAIAKDDGLTHAVPGESLTYTLVADNRSFTGVLYGLVHQGRDGPSTLYLVDHLSGAASAVGAVGFERCSGLATDAAQRLFATCERQDGSDTHVLITIDAATGAGTEVGPTGIELLGGFDTATDISFRHGDGALFAFLEPGDFLARIDPATGAATLVGPTMTFCCGNGIVFSAADVLYHANDVDLSTLDQAAGTAATVAALGYPIGLVFPRINALALEAPSGTVYGSLRTQTGNFLTTVDLTTGAVTIVGPTAGGLDAIAFGRAGLPVSGALVSDPFPADLSCTWTCTPAAGASCTAGPVAGDVNDTIDLPADSSVTYTASCAIDPAAALGTLLSNTATIAPPAGAVDADPSSNSATDTTQLVAGIGLPIPVLSAWGSALLALLLAGLATIFLRRG